MMKIYKHSQTVFKLIKLVSILTLLSIVCSLGYIVSTLYKAAHNQLIIWCGNTVIEPIIWIVNVLVPFGFFINIFYVFLAHKKNTKHTVCALTVMLLFVCASALTILTGAIFCEKKLDGIVFRSFIWWL